MIGTDSPRFTPNTNVQLVASFNQDKREITRRALEEANECRQSYCEARAMMTSNTARFI
jgi:hypothetical protein